MILPLLRVTQLLPSSCTAIFQNSYLIKATSRDSVFSRITLLSTINSLHFHSRPFLGQLLSTISCSTTASRAILPTTGSDQAMHLHVIPASGERNRENTPCSSAGNVNFEPAFAKTQEQSKQTRPTACVLRLCRAVATGVFAGPRGKEASSPRACCPWRRARSRCTLALRHSEDRALSTLLPVRLRSAASRPPVRHRCHERCALRRRAPAMSDLELWLECHKPLPSTIPMHPRLNCNWRPACTSPPPELPSPPPACPYPCPARHLRLPLL